MEHWGDYVFDFDHDGKTFSFYVRAKSKEDAIARWKSIVLSSRYEGGPVTIIPFEEEAPGRPQRRDH